MLEAYARELTTEGAITRRVLERIPNDRLAWQPHDKSMSLGQLAMHVATIPQTISRLASLDEFDVANASFAPPDAESVEGLLATLDGAIAAAAAYLATVDDDAARREWRLLHNGNVMFAVPRVDMLRTMLFNHWYHHRGQLSVYLRLLDVPVPIIYGRSADESPFAAASA